MNKPKNNGLVLIGVGSIFSSMIIAGFLLGYLVDRWLNTMPVLMMVFGCLGFIGGLIKVYKLLTNPELY